MPPPPLSLHSCHLWMVVKENPDRKKTKKQKQKQLLNWMAARLSKDYQQVTTDEAYLQLPWRCVWYD